HLDCAPEFALPPVRGRWRERCSSAASSQIPSAETWPRTRTQLAMNHDSEAPAPRSRLYVRIPRTILRKVGALVRIVVMAVVGLAALVAALIALDAALLGESRRRH